MGMGMRRRYSRQSSPPERDPSDERYYVYRLFDADGQVLYVGRSANPRTRLQQHRFASEWAHGVRDMEMAGPFTWAEAIAQERQQIEADQPPHNRMYAA